MRRTGNRVPTIRGQLTRIVLIPSLCFLVLWLVAAVVGTGQAAQLMGTVNQAREGTEVFSMAADKLRDERRLALVELGRAEGDGSDGDGEEDVEDQRASTDTALTEAVNLADRLRGTNDEAVNSSAAAVAQAPEDLEETRSLVDSRSAGREETLLRYDELLDSVQDAVTALVHTTDGGENLTDAVLTRELFAARSDYATADALLAGVIAAGEMSYEETAHFTYLTAAYRETLESVSPNLSSNLSARYEAMTDQPGWGQAESISREVVTRPPVADPESAEPTTGGESPNAEWNTDIEVGAADWNESSASALTDLDALALAQAERTVDLAWSTALLRVSLGVAVGAVTLVAGAVAITLVGRSSRRLTDRLARLRGQILERDEDMPHIIERAQRGRKVEVQEELPPLDECADDEIGQVAEAFDSAQLTAVEAAVRQAEIRRGANKAFLGIAFRNQTLVQRQLQLLDQVEDNERDPEVLSRLFQLDHLVTRARRYADNLIILGGGQSARRWRQPRPLVDVLRAAVAETEDFERVRLVSAPRVLMHGQVVADVVHLLAELVENATQFSPAGSPVDVSCAPVSGGLAVDVEDRGLGMSEHGYAAAERTLTQPPEFDVMALPDDPRLGLFVVSRLAERHRIQVKLRPSPYGGTRATALIPESLLEPVDNPVAVTGTPPGAWNPQGPLAPAGAPGPRGGPVTSTGPFGVPGQHGHQGPYQPFPGTGPLPATGPRSPHDPPSGPQQPPPPVDTGPFTAQNGYVPGPGSAGPEGTAPPGSPPASAPLHPGGHGER